MLKRALSAVAVAGLVVALTPGVSNATASNTPTPGTPSFDGSVNVVVHRGSTVYVAGSFTHVTDTARTVNRKGLAAFNVETGLVSAWNPKPNGLVRSLTVKKKSVYAAGDFTRIRTTKRLHVAQLNRAGKGKLTRFAPRVHGGTVNAITVAKRTVFFGGDFKSVSGTPRNKLASVVRSSGKVRASWHPEAVNGVVRDLVARGHGVFVAGEFRMLNGNEVYQRLAEVTKKNGRIVAAFNPPTSRDVFDIAVTGDSVYAAIGGLFGGAASRVARDTGAAAWTRHFNGDGQAITPLGSEVYVGGHFSTVCDDAAQNRDGDCLNGSTSRGKGASFNLGGALTAWNPQVNGSLGIRGLDRYPSVPQLLAVGDFTTANNGASQVHGLAAFDG